MTPMMEESLEKLWYLRREIDRVFREYFYNRQAKPGEQFVDIPVDIYESEGEIVVEAELPGCEKKDISVFFQADMLIIEGVKHGEENIKGNLTISERKEGSFRRVIELSRAANTQKAVATFADGVLTIKLPKIIERRGQKRKIEIG
ncbi:MAG: Hsp20/alpha crystallin family protein [Myxococcota bacterium]